MVEKPENPRSQEPFCVIVPCFNEEGNIEPLAESMLGVFDRFNLPGRILIVDDGSTDGTGRAADGLALRHDRIKVLHQPENRGLARALGLAFSAAEEEILITTDADQSMDPCYIPALLEKLEQYDMVIASRHMRGGRIEGFPAHRVMVSRAANALASICLNLGIHDVTCGYRAYRKKYLTGALSEDAAMGSFQVEILWRARRNGARIGEIPIVEKPRVCGESKLRLGLEIISFIRLILKLRFS
jgi:dolichol-phosphate mannosyltransferase